MADDLSYAWLNALNDIIENGSDVAPRGQATKEVLQRTMEVDMRRPVLTVLQRKLSYRFMAAEAYWILSGDDRVETIAPYNKNISQFSDDGKTFFGAYGPKIYSQLDYVINKLRHDRSTRQAGLTLWRECPPETKDVPCTVAIFFNIRGDLDSGLYLNCHVFMRSSDVWLGVPYDVFNFSMLSHLVCCHLNGGANPELYLGNLIKPGTLYLTAASQHLYVRNLDEAIDCLSSPYIEQFVTPVTLFIDAELLMSWLSGLRDSKPGESFMRWWEVQDETVS